MLSNVLQARVIVSGFTFYNIVARIV